MKQIDTMEEFSQLCAAGRGFVYNDFAGEGARGKEENILHAARCGELRKANLWEKNKYFFDDLDEALAWLTRHRNQQGQNWKVCGPCRRRGDIVIMGM
jgi:hypothetical protein